MAGYDEDNLVLGTIKDGLVIYSIKKQSIKHINKGNGLINNTVLGLKFQEGNLWVALDNGIGKVDFKSPFTYYKDLINFLDNTFSDKEYTKYMEDTFTKSKERGKEKMRTKTHKIKF